MTDYKQIAHVSVHHIVLWRMSSCARFYILAQKAPTLQAFRRPPFAIKWGLSTSPSIPLPSHRIVSLSKGQHFNWLTTELVTSSSISQPGSRHSYRRYPRPPSLQVESRGGHFEFPLPLPSFSRVSGMELDHGRFL